MVMDDWKKRLEVSVAQKSDAGVDFRQQKNGCGFQTDKDKDSIRNRAASRGSVDGIPSSCRND